MKRKNFKIPVGFTHSWYNKLTTTEKRDMLLKYLTLEALSIILNEKMNEEKVPKTNEIIDSTGLCYSLIGGDLFEFIEEGFAKCMNCGQTLSRNKTQIKLTNGFIVCSSQCYLDIKVKQSKNLYIRTGVKLQEFNKIHKEWRKKTPFHQDIPSEITFLHGEEDNFPEEGFNWKISIPDFLDQYYWPLQKKEMTSIDLSFQPNDQNHSDSLV